MKPKNRWKKSLRTEKTAHIFTPIPQTAGHFQNRKTTEKLSKNQKQLIQRYQHRKTKNKRTPPPFLPVCIAKTHVDNLPC